MIPRLIVPLTILVLMAGSSSAIAQRPLDASWLREYDGPSDYDVVKDLAVDNRGGAVVTGIVTVRYSPTGDTTTGAGGWVAPGGDAVAVDHQGSVFVISTVVDPGTGKNFLTRKYSSTGVLLWERRYNGPASGTDSTVAVAVDASGFAVVVGNSVGTSTGIDCVTIRYTPSGDTAESNGGWVRRYLTPQSAIPDFAYGVKIGPDGSTYTLGSTCESGCAHFVVKYSPTGDTAMAAGGWVCRSVGSGFNYGRPVAICVDSDGYVGVAGYDPHDRCCTGDYTNSDYFTSCINPAGTELWSHIYGGYGYDSKAGDIEADPAGNLYVTGKSRWLSDTASDYVTIKYDRGGNPVWQSPFRGSHNYLGRSDDGKKLALGPKGTVFVTGNSMHQNAYFEFDAQFATIALDPATGQGIDTAYYDKYAYGNEDVEDVEADTLGNVFVAGMSCDPYGNTNNCADQTMVVIKYGSTVVTGILGDPRDPVPENFSLSQNYPNPFNASTVIPFELDRDAHVTIQVFNVLGQQIKTLVDGDLPLGSHSVAWDATTANGDHAPSGLYFYTLSKGGYRMSKSMVLLKWSMESTAFHCHDFGSR